MMTEFDPLSISSRMATLADMADTEMIRQWAEEIAQIEAVLGRWKKMVGTSMDKIKQLKTERDALVADLKKITSEDRDYIFDALPYDWEPYHILKRLQKLVEGGE